MTSGVFAAWGVNGEDAATLRGVNLDADGPAIAFAAFGEPLGERGGEAGGVDAKAGFEAAVGGGERVVEFGRAGEVAHAEGVEPVEGAGLALAGDNDFDDEFSGVHLYRAAQEHLQLDAALPTEPG